MTAAEPFYCDESTTIYHGDCREILPTLGRFQTVITDPPYGKVRGDFDHAWTNRRAMLADVIQWRDAIVAAMTANATLWWFAWPSLAGMIEASIAEVLNPLAHVVWKKPTTLANKHCPEHLRAPGPETERILMFEQYGADNWALGEAGYGAKCDELRGHVFRPLIDYFIGQRDAAGITAAEVARIRGCSTTMIGQHHFSASQWALPSPETYAAMRQAAPGYFRREYEELRREYEGLRREYEGLRRYFALRQGHPKTDLWEFPTQTTDRPNHPTPKPLELIRFIVEISARPGSVIVDPFMGSGTTLLAAKLEGRRAIGIEINEEYCELAANRLAQGVLF
jgi:site-specific DNA-methyltransferase (adenine-specific)